MNFKKRKRSFELKSQGMLQLGWLREKSLWEFRIFLSALI
jgi:hypothetical protein